MTSKQNPVELANPDDPRVFPLLHEYWEALQRQENLELDPWLRQHPEGCAGRGDFEVLAELHRAAQVITEDSRLDSADTAEIAALKKGRQVLPAGTLVGECRVESLLGQGGMGAVYLAYHTKLQQRVALKVLPDERMGHPAAVARFEREMAAVGQLDHPNVVRARHAGQAGGIHFLLMDFVEGSDLARLVKNGGPLRPTDACQIIAQAALALQHAHEKKLIHRDLKPSNLMLTPDGQVKVLDFGLSLLQDQRPSDLTGTDQIMGTADYMAPEQWLDAHTVTIQADLYSLGCTLYYLLSGQAPFSGPGCQTMGQKMRAHQDQAPPPLTRSDLPAGLQAVLDRLLAKKPEQRFATPAEVAEALQPFTAGHDLLRVLQPETRPSTLPLPAPVQAPSKGRYLLGVPRRRWLIAAVLLLAVGGPLVYFLAQITVDVPGKGKLIIVADDRNVEVTIKQKDGKPLVVVVEKAGKRQFELTPGDYVLDVREVPDGVRFQTKEFTLTRNGKETVSVRFLARIEPPGPITVPPPAKELSPLDALDSAKILPKHRQDGMPQEVVAVLPGPFDWVICFAFAPDGRRLVASYGNPADATQYLLVLWDVVAGKEIHRFDGIRRFGAHSVAFSPDGRRILSAGWTYGMAPSIELWDAETGKSIRSFGTRDINVIVFSPDGKRALTGDRHGHDGPGSVCLWDVETGDLIKDFPGHTYHVGCVAFSSDGRQALSCAHGTDNTMRLWNLETKKNLGVWKHPSGMTVAFFADGRQGITACADGNVRVWDLSKQAKEPKAVFGGHAKGIGYLNLSADGKKIATLEKGQRIIVWDPTTGQRFQQWQVPSENPPFVFAPDSRHLAVGAGKGNVWIFRLPSPKGEEPGN